MVVQELAVEENAAVFQRKAVAASGIDGIQLFAEDHLSVGTHVPAVAQVTAIIYRHAAENVNNNIFACHGVARQFVSVLAVERMRAAVNNIRSP